MFKGFEAVFDKNSTILILGSFPSVKSRENGFYYGNKQNRFWHMLEQIFQTEIPDNIEAKKSFLKQKKIALYDVITESNLHGSSDLALEKSQHKASEISFLLPPNTKVKKILCNGKTAYNSLLQIYGLNNQFVQENKATINSIPVLYMSSTSPENPRYNFEIWKKEIKE